MKNRIYGNGYFVVPSYGWKGSKLNWSLSYRVDRNVHTGNEKEEEKNQVGFTLNVKYKDMFKPDLYKEAYEEVKNKYNKYIGKSTEETLEGMSIKWIKKTIEDLKSRKFQFKPSVKKLITKKNGKTRTLGIPSPRDKIVQKVFYKLLEKEYEKIFLKTSHGYRPKKSCHTALKQVLNWTGVTWMIEGDIKSYFDNIDHHKLAEILSRNIKDKNIIDLYWKLVKAGYVEENEEKKIKYNSLGIPQGGNVSPILSNIYLHVFDMYIEELKKEYKTSTISKQSTEYNKAISPYKKAVKAYTENPTKENLKTLKVTRKRLLSTNFSTRTGINMHYVRYADDWLIGIIGPKKIAEEIKEKVRKFLKEELLIELNTEKTKITNVRQNLVKYLGYKIKVTDKEYYQSKLHKRGKVLQRAANGRVKLYIPTEDIVERLREKGFVRLTAFKGKYYGPWVPRTDTEIVINYRAIIIGYMNYYILADDYTNIKDIVYLLKYSAAHTLAAKYKTSIAKIFTKYGKAIKVVYGNTKKTISLDYTPVIENKFPPKEETNFPSGNKKEVSEKDPLNISDYGTRSIYSLDKPCKICGSKLDIEMHHVRHLKDLNPKLPTIVKNYAKLTRKQIPVCRECHMKIHSGKYDGDKL